MASLHVTGHVFDVLHRNLSSDEEERAGRFIFTLDRNNFVVTRGILRDILAQYLDCQPGEIHFKFEPQGKPVVSLPDGSTQLEFNLAHSSGLLALAVSGGRKVGVDIERVRPLSDLEGIASHAFSSYEQKELSKLTGEEKYRGFFRCWTRKEAYLKARGDGLLVPLDTFDMSLAANNPIRMLSNRFDPDEVSLWSFYTFKPEKGFIGALAMQGQEVVPNFRRWIPAEV